jgi:putative IMPACT (imprinted ancient) family translation regulator
LLAALPPEPEAKEARQAESEEDLSDVQWVSSEVLRDRKSRFVAFAAPCDSPVAGKRFWRAVRARAGVEDATHVVTAYRTESGECEREDDGEGGAGDALLELLERRGGAGRALAVARWYGGVKLGGDRFRHIVAMAKEALLLVKET